MILKKPFCKEFSLCDQTHFLIIKGISILVIVLVHLCNRYLEFAYLSPLAGAAVAVFLLCSGYGLSESYEKKNGLGGYWVNKITKIWLPSFLKLSFISLVTLSGIYSWLTEYPLFLYGWYLQVLFGEYLVFWVLFRFVKSKKLRLCGLFAASAVAFLLIDSQLYAEQMLSFPLGVAFSQLGLKDKVSGWKIKEKILLIAGCAVVAAGSFVLRNRFQQHQVFNLIWMLFKLSLAILICMLPWILRKVPVFSMFIPLGEISYMLYLINNNVLALLDGRVTWYAVVLVILILLVAAVLFKKLCDKLAKVCLNLWNQRKSSVA